MDSEEMDYIWLPPITSSFSNPLIYSKPVKFPTFSTILNYFSLAVLVFGLFDNTTVAIVLIYLQKQKQKLNNSTNVVFLKKQRLNW